MFARSLSLVLILAQVCSRAYAEIASASNSALAMPKSADSFVDTIGMDSHFNYRTSPYVLEWSKISTELVASGIRHIRDGGQRFDQASLARYAYLGQHGIRHSVGFSNDVTPERIDSALRATMPYVDFVEPANEFDGYKATDPAWAQKLTAMQRTIYSTVHANSSYAGITVLGPALSHQALYAEVGALDDAEDAGNLHWATCNSNPGVETKEGFARAESLLRASTVSKPFWTTETGYNDEVGVRPCAIPDDLIARYAPRMIAERFNDGMPRVYFYQLVKMPSDKIFGGTGFIDPDGAPTPQFTALTSLISLLSDPGRSVTMKPIALDIRSAERDVHHTLLEKRDHTYELLLWRELSGWQDSGPSRIGGTRIPIAPAGVTVSVPHASSVRYFQYDSNWKLRPRALDGHPSGSIRLDVTDAVSVLEFRAEDRP